jgi:hypothetical protein
MKVKKAISKLMKVFLVSGLYFSFFAVQLFFNFDVANSQKSYLSRLAFGNQDTTTKGHFHSQKTSVASKENIRLNKRFEPKSLQVVNAPLIEIYSIYYKPLVLGLFDQENLYSCIRLSSFLRGPPAIA